MSAQGEKRRAEILRFVQDYVAQHDYGPTETAIGEHVGYRGHNLRPMHLDKMPEIYKGENGRWMATVEKKTTVALMTVRITGFTIPTTFDRVRRRGAPWYEDHLRREQPFADLEITVSDGDRCATLTEDLPPVSYTHLTLPTILLV